MARDIQRISIRSKVVALVAGLFALLMLFLAVFIPMRLNRSSSIWAERQAKGIARVLASAARVPLDLSELQGPEELDKLLRLLADAPDAVYGAIRQMDGELITAWNPNGLELPDLRAEPDTDPETWSDHQLLNVAAPIRVEGQTRGVLQIGFSRERVEAEQRASTWLIVLTMLAIFTAGLVLLAMALGRLLIDPILSLTRRTLEIVQSGDLTLPIEHESSDEIGELAEGIRTLVGQQRQIMRTLRGLGDALQEVIGQISQAALAVVDGAGNIRKRVSEASGLVDQVRDTISSTQQSVEDLHGRAEHSSTTAQQMAVTNEQSSANIQEMATFVSETTEAIDTMAMSVRDIAGNVEQVRSAVDETSISMTELESSILQVEQNAIQAADLSAEVSKNADSGVSSLQATLQGIEGIRKSFDLTSRTFDALLNRIFEVSSIMHVIDEITAQTNLLALNAAIISAQAGEHGRGFGVVAEEIRALADRTKTSTQEIGELIQAIQDDSDRAKNAMQEGMEAVHTGVELGQGAAKALAEIQISARGSTERVQQIASATVEQAQGNKAIAAAVSRIAETMAEIHRASSEQARGSELIIKSTGKMNQINNQVFGSSQEQAVGSRKVIEAMVRIHDIVQEVRQGQVQQTDVAQRVLNTIDAIETTSSEQDASAAHLERVVEVLQRQAHELRQELGRFRTG